MQTTASLSFTPASLTLTGTESKNLTVTLSVRRRLGADCQPQCKSGGIVNVPATASIAANATTATVAVQGVSAG